MTAADCFSGHAASYVRFRPVYPAGVFDFLSQVAPARRCAWDAGTGNGQAAGELAACFDRVVATDISATQLCQAKPHPRVEHRVASAEESGIEDGALNLVTAFQAAHWFDLQRFFAEVKRVLAPRGVCAILCYGRCRINDDVDDIVDRFYSQTVGPYWPPQRRLVETGYRTVDFPFGKLQTPSFQIQCEWDLGAFVSYLRTWSATQRFIKDRHVDPLIEFMPLLENAWGRDVGLSDVTWPLHARVGRLLSPAKIALR